VPRNPFINAGALVTLDRVRTRVCDYPALLLDLVKFLSASDAVRYDPTVNESERDNAHTNFALAHLLKAYGRLESSVDDLLSDYFQQCSLAMSCRQLSRTFIALANRGLSPIVQEAVVTARQAKRINSLMLTCGMYDSVGNFAFRVGLPAKSGVGGGIVAVVPDRMCIATWAPELDLSGNSYIGVLALERFTEITGLSVF
jgi:glutaminase